MQVQTHTQHKVHTQELLYERKKNCLYSQTHRATKVHMLPAPLKVNTAVAFEGIF